MFYRLAFALFVPLLVITDNCNAQEWVKMNTGAYRLNYLFFQDFIEIFKGPDSIYYVVTRHEKDKYWHKRKKGELLVSKIEEPDSISFVAHLNQYAYKPKIKIRGGKYYLLGDHHYGMSYLYVYDSSWQLAQFLEIELPAHQDGIQEFDVRKDGTIFFLTHPYKGWKQPKNSNSLLKFSPDGSEEATLFYDTTHLSDLRVSGDSLFFSRQRFKMMRPNKWDSPIERLYCNGSLNCVVSVSTENHPRQKKSSEADTYFADIPQYYNSYTDSGWSFIIKTETVPEHDSIKLVLYPSTGENKLLRKWERTSNSGIFSVRLLGHYYFAADGLPWIFYNVFYTDRHEDIFFERINL